MHVLEVCSLYKPHAGGVETMAEELGKRLLEDGQQVSVLTKQWPTELASYEGYEGIPVYRVPTANTTEEQRGLARTISTISKELTPDVIHVIGLRRPLPLHALLLSKHLKVPIIGTVVGSEVPDPHDASIGWIWDSGKDYVRPSLLQFNLVNAVSKAIAMNTAKVLPERGEIPVMPVGIDGSLYNRLKSSDAFPAQSFILSLRRLEHSKGIDLLIDAYSQLIRDHNYHDLVIAGDGPQKEALQQQVDLLDITHRVHFLGKVAFSEGIGLLKSAAMTVVPSRSEGGGLINAEANAVGCPLIATDVGGIREYTSPNACCLVEHESPGEIYRAMKSVIENPQIVAKKVAFGKELSKELDWDKLYNRYKAMYFDQINVYKPRQFQPWSEQTAQLFELVQGSQ